MIKKRKTFIKISMYTMAILITLLIYTNVSFANSYISNDSLLLNNVIEGEKGPEFIYNNEIFTITPLLSNNNVFGLIGYKTTNQNNKVNYYYFNTPIVDFNIPNNFKSDKTFPIETIHYELDDKGNLNYIMRSDNKVFIKDITELNKNNNNLIINTIYNIKEAPSWVDNIYTEEELNSLNNNKPLLFMDSKQNTTKVKYNNTFYNIEYLNNTLYYLNIKTNSFLHSSLSSSLLSELILSEYNEEDVSKYTINIEETPVVFLKSSSVMMYNQKKMLKKIKEKDFSSFSELTSFVKDEISSATTSDIEEGLKKTSKKYKIKNKEDLKKNGKELEIESGKIKETITLTNKNSYISIKDDDIFICRRMKEEKENKKDKNEVLYYVKCNNKVLDSFIKGEEIEGKMKEEKKVEIKFEEIEDAVVFDVPNDAKGCRSEAKTYMPYTAVTSKSSNQYKLLYSDKAYTDERTGLRMYDGRYCIAVGTAYASKIGTKIDVVLENGKILNCILGDVKSDAHTDSSHQFHAIDGSVVEFIVDYDFFNRKDHLLNKGKMKEKVKKIIVEKQQK